MRCALSSREVKSTPVKSFVVTLPSMVMAKVTATNGRFPPFRILLRRPDFMLECGDFALHFAQLHMARLASWLVEEVNQSAGRGAEQNNEKAHRTNEDGDGFGDAAQAVQHDLQNVF